MILNLIDLVTVGAFIMLMALGIFRNRRAVSLLNVERAIRTYMLAALVEFINAATDLMQVTENGWVPLAMSATCLAGCVVTISLTVKRADLMEGIR